MKLAIGEGAVFARLTFPDDGSLIGTAIFKVLVDAAFANVELPSDEPLGVGRFPFKGFGPVLLPDKFFGFARPENAGLLDRLLVHALVLRHAFDAGFF